MKPLKSVSLLLIFGLFLLSACATQTMAPAPAPEPAARQAPVADKQTAALSDWQVKWNNLSAAAKKEGVLSMYSTQGSSVRDGISKPILEKLGLKLEFLTGKGEEISQRTITERRAGIYVADVYVGGATSVLTLVKPTGALAQIEKELFLPEALDKKTWFGGDLRWIDKDRQLLAFVNYQVIPITVNTSLVNPQEIKSYKDLLNPKWKGKIVINDPTVTGTGEKFFLIVGGQIMGYDFMRELVKQEPVITRDQRLQVEWLAQGKYPIGTTTKPEIVTDFQRAGVPLAYVSPAEGMWTSAGGGNVALYDKPAHPKAAQLFVNWLLTREGQSIFARALGVPSGRLDASVEGLDKDLLLQPGMKYIAGDSEELLLKAAEERKITLEIVAPLLKK